MSRGWQQDQSGNWVPFDDDIEDDVVWLRKVDEGTDNECWVVCAKGDNGAVAFAPV